MAQGYRAGHRGYVRKNVYMGYGEAAEVIYAPLLNA
jgi:hypothetical protein